MTPFGKPAARVTPADIQQLIDDKVPEGRHLEYKRDIPISDEEQKQARGAGRGDPQDRSWLQNRPLRAFGRDKLMEELVAFANADGGVLILGITETKSEPARANGFNLLPDVVSLERRLRDALVDCIEPRLPFASVVAVPTEPSGAGVVILETEQSRLGPHRVRRTREATIRREDRCDQMTMAEIHDMVIRNARRFDAVTALVNASPSGWPIACSVKPRATLRAIAMNWQNELRQEIAKWPVSLPPPRSTAAAAPAFACWQKSTSTDPQQRTVASQPTNDHSTPPPSTAAGRKSS